MFSWATLVSLLVTLAVEVVKYLQRRGDLDKERLADALKHLEAVNDLVRDAQRASSVVDDSADAVVRDPDNRDADGSAGGQNTGGGVQ